VYFTTLVTHDRVNLFGKIIDEVMQLNVLGEIISVSWLRLPIYSSIQLGEWVIMPNHLHEIVWLLESSMGEESAPAGYKNQTPRSVDSLPQQQLNGTKSGSLSAIIQNYKSISARKIN
jgi:putative transposase